MKVPLKGRISSRFGYRKHPVSGANSSFHNGIDIAAPVGTAILAPADGIITESWNHDKGGICLAMMAGRTRFGFAHLDKRLVKVNDPVKAGETIALSGNTGASTGPHLHFTVKINGTFIDPERVINF